MIDAQNEKNIFGERKWVTPHEFLSIISVIYDKDKPKIINLLEIVGKNTKQGGPYEFKLIQDYGKIF